MKKPNLTVNMLMAGVSVCFLLFTLGFFIGRNFNHSTVEVTTISVTEPKPAATATVPHTSGSEIVNINTASKAELMTLPGIGEVFAQRIVAYRNQNGPYQQVEDLLNVEGIGAGRLEAILDLVTTGG